MQVVSVDSGTDKHGPAPIIPNTRALQLVNKFPMSYYLLQNGGPVLYMKTALKKAI